MSQFYITRLLRGYLVLSALPYTRRNPSLRGTRVGTYCSCRLHPKSASLIIPCSSMRTFAHLIWAEKKGGQLCCCTIVTVGGQLCCCTTLTRSISWYGIRVHIASTWYLGTHIMLYPDLRETTGNYVHRGAQPRVGASRIQPQGSGGYSFAPPTCAVYQTLSPGPRETPQGPIQ